MAVFLLSLSEALVVAVVAAIVVGVLIYRARCGT